MTPKARLFFSTLPLAKFILFTSSIFFSSIAVRGENKTTSSEAAGDTAKAPTVLHWTNKDGSSCDGSFLRLDEQNRVIVQSVDSGEVAIPYAGLDGNSRRQAKAAGKLPSISVLILGDSMSLDGYGKRLDETFRDHPHVGEVHTYMACGTHPLSWLKAKPYSTIKTYCGFWSIESVKDSIEPKEMNAARSYGSRAQSFQVPKMETLLETIKPDVLVMQSGNNFFSFFADQKTIDPVRHPKQISAYMGPFIEYLANNVTTVRKLYWVTPPQNGKVTEDIQQFVFDQISANTHSLATMIDSRKLTHYPYKIMSKDKEHFEGREVSAWADDTFSLIAQDLFVRRDDRMPTLHEAALAMGGWNLRDPKETPSSAIKVRAKLLSKTSVPAADKFAPYREFMVGFQYQIETVIEGKYEAKKLLVMHPAYIDLMKQPLEKMRVGKSYVLQLRELDKTSLWNAIRREDGSDSFDLEPYILTSDELRYPQPKIKNTATPVAAKSNPQS